MIAFFSKLYLAIRNRFAVSPIDYYTVIFYMSVGYLSLNKRKPRGKPGGFYNGSKRIRPRFPSIVSIAPFSSSLTFCLIVLIIKDSVNSE